MLLISPPIVEFVRKRKLKMGAENYSRFFHWRWRDQADFLKYLTMATKATTTKRRIVAIFAKQGLQRRRRRSSRFYVKWTRQAFVHTKQQIWIVQKISMS
jgi:hypothetical protein